MFSDTYGRCAKKCPRLCAAALDVGQRQAARHPANAFNAGLEIPEMRRFQFTAISPGPR
jgi:hypothetical protein